MLHYKFRNTKNWTVVKPQTGNLFSVLELKRVIISSLKLTRHDFDLVLQDAQTGVLYAQDGFRIPNNSTIVVRRIPNHRAEPIVVSSDAQISLPEIANEPQLSPTKDCSLSARKDCSASFGDDIYEAEEIKMKQVLEQASHYKSVVIADVSKPKERPLANLDAKFDTKFDTPRKRVCGIPQSYICKRCEQRGHWLRNCPTNGDPKFDPKRPATGIPKMFLRAVGENAENVAEGIDSTERRSANPFDKDQSLEFDVRPNRRDFQRFYE